MIQAIQSFFGGIFEVVTYKKKTKTLNIGVI